ncbi:MAG: peroxide stress protein YaaA [Actinobacteria bacterium]|uniref:Unannotated protein n=1 Tax=freshwater metagenome TaxID=449393 RepID=A0A6J6BSD4_9ZZZZ|nr:peroxide stress protein YaaA [Actinomycetota bacterium]
MAVSHHLALWSPDFPRCLRNAVIRATLQWVKDTSVVTSATMLILLPPSEGKYEPSRSKKLNLSSLSFAEDLTQPREQTLAQYRSINQSKCDAAAQVYSGVLYQSLDYASLSPAAKKRADKSIVIISAAFGALRLTDFIPYYKFKIEPKLWKAPLALALSGLDDELVVDMRSSTYATVWTPNPLNTVGIRIFTKVGGQKKVITHMSKKYRGEVARYLVSQSSNPKKPQELLALLSKKFSCTLVKPGGKKSWFIDLIV